MCSSLRNAPVLIIILVNCILGSEEEVKLHYPNRLLRSSDDGISVAASIFSIIVFVFYLFIVLGFMKACFGLCCNAKVGRAGLNILLDVPKEDTPVDVNKSSEFFLNVIFFLVAPYVLVRGICASKFGSKHKRRKQTPRASHFRMTAGGAQPSSKPSKKSLPIDKSTKDNIEVYGDDDDSENQDTKYVLEQMHRSEQSLRSGTYPFAISENSQLP